MEDPPTAPFAEFLETVSTTENTDQSSSDFEVILEQELQRLRNLPFPTTFREYCLDQYVQALAKNEHLKSLFFEFTTFTDIIFLKHLHSHATLRSLQLTFEPRDANYDYHYDLLDDPPQGVEIEDTLANFVGLKNLDIRAHHFRIGAPRFAQALLRGTSQNPSLQYLGIFYMDDFGLQELDWKASKLEKLEIDACDFSFSTWKSLLSIPSLESLKLHTLLGWDRERRIPRHVMTRQHVFRSLPVQCRSIRNLCIKWQESDVADLESMLRFFEFEKLTLDLTHLLLQNDEPVQDFPERFSRICGLVYPTTNSKLYFVFDSITTSEILSGFPDVLRTLLRIPAVVGMVITHQHNFDEHSSQYLRILTENGEHLERLDMSGIVFQDDEIVKIIASFPRLQYLTTYAYPTSCIAEAVDAHPNLLKLDFKRVHGDWDTTLADRARGSIETSLLRNRANRFARRIASRTCSENGAGLKVWPTILSNVDKGNVAAMSGVFLAFLNDMGEEMVHGAQPSPSEKMAAGRKRRHEKEAEE